MNNDDPVDALIQEVDDYLDISAVGLYEFMWILNGDKVEGSRDQHRDYAFRALRSLLDKDRGRLVLLVWPGKDPVAELNREVEPDDFNDPGDDPYVAITRD
jgi:hypothetical protein